MLEFTSDNGSAVLNAPVYGDSAIGQFFYRSTAGVLGARGLQVGVGTSGIERQTGKDKTCVWRWQERFMREGVDGLLRDKTRRPGKPPLATVIERVVALTAMTGQGTSQARATLRSSPK